MLRCNDSPPGADGQAAIPSRWVARFAPLVPADRSVLDLACGSGRHSRLLLDLGLRVLAVDRDARPVRTSLGGRPGLVVLECDLESAPPFEAGGPLEGRQFGGIVVTNYLHRPLWQGLIAAVAPGGVLIYETFAAGNERFGRPSNPAFLLRPGELLEAVSGRLEVVAYENGIVDVPKPAAIQRICARRPVDAVPCRLP
ncbi:MAG: SAM-dependent methyltransferase [Alphaproteobacteria bacterium]|nr:SAM-dependent methyltransferase [Alphaproteobacteria bacterium]